MKMKTEKVKIFEAVYEADLESGYKAWMKENYDKITVINRHFFVSSRYSIALFYKEKEL